MNERVLGYPSIDFVFPLAHRMNKYWCGAQVYYLQKS